MKGFRGGSSRFGGSGGRKGGHYHSSKGRSNTTRGARTPHHHHRDDPPASQSSKATSNSNTVMVNGMTISCAAKPGLMHPDGKVRLQIMLPKGLYHSPHPTKAAQHYKILHIPPSTGSNAPPPPNGFLITSWRELPRYALEVGLPPDGDGVSAPTPSSSAVALPHSGEQLQQPQLAPVEPASTTTIATTNATGSGQLDYSQMSNRQRKKLMREEDLDFYCEPCQKGFRTEDRYKSHMEQHVNCTFEGCGFNCHKEKMYKMEEHVQLLHLRMNAPNLADPEKYIAQRKQRFPTKGNVSQSVEELFYIHARGERLPRERVRWLEHQLRLPEFQHLAQQRTARDGKEEEEAAHLHRKRAREESAEDSAEESRSGSVSSSSSKAASASGESKPHTAPVPPLPAAATPPAVPDASQGVFADLIRMVQASGNPELLRATMQAFERNRLAAAPATTTTTTTAAPDATLRPPPPPPPVLSSQSSSATHPNHNPPQNDFFYEDVQVPPVAQSARLPPGATSPPAREATKVMAPVAAGKLARLSHAEAQQRAANQPSPAYQPNQATERHPVPHTGDLYKQLTRDAQIDDLSLLLQSFQLFKYNNFFDQAPPQ